VCDTTRNLQVVNTGSAYTALNGAGIKAAWQCMYKNMPVMQDGKYVKTVI